MNARCMAADAPGMYGNCRAGDVWQLPRRRRMAAVGKLQITRPPDSRQTWNQLSGRSLGAVNLGHQVPSEMIVN